MARLVLRGLPFPSKRRERACHEAAHAVACVHLGGRFDFVRLGQEERPRLGADVVSVGQFCLVHEGRDPRLALRNACIYLAALAFEKLVRPWRSYAQLRRGPSVTDCEFALQWCGLLETDAAAAESLCFNHALPLARHFVLERWNSILRVGKALDRAGELTQVEVENVIRGR